MEIELTENLITRLQLSDVRNLQAQANARYILYGVREREENFPRFNPQLTERAHSLAYMHIEVACDLYMQGNYAAASAYFENGAELLEYNNVPGVTDDDTTGFNLLIGALSYYCASQYSKSFVLMRRYSYEPVMGRLAYLFLTKNLRALEGTTKQVLLSNIEDGAVDAYQAMLAKALQLTVNYFYYGDEGFIHQAEEMLKDGIRLALIGNDPSVWWVFRLVHIIVGGIHSSSLWENVGNNPKFKVDGGGWVEAFKQIGVDYMPVFDMSANLRKRQYINSLAFRRYPVTELFVSQRKALEKVLEVNGAVVSMPTSSGKTRIAELVILQTLMFDSSSKILYIAPYRSLSYEMEETLSATFNPMEYYVTHLYGSAQYTTLDREEMEQARVIIATPEKAKAILRVNDEMVQQIRLVVMDEGHLLGYKEREVANEMFSEELHCIVRRNAGRFLVLSAVLPNAEEMSAWLASDKDNVVKDTWRPSSQRLGVMMCYKRRLDIEWYGSPRCFNPAFVVTEGEADKKLLTALATLKLVALGSILIYCPRTGEVLSNARVMLQLIANEPDTDWGDGADWMRFELICQESEESKVYLELARKGILCHSAALKSEVRRFTERLLRKGKARFIYATNTLAQGVNLGVSTVIVIGTMRSPGDYLNQRDFWNMAGRAGRSFVDTEGKILMVCDCRDRAKTDTNKWIIENRYLGATAVEKVESGVYLRLQELKKIQEKLGIDFDQFLQLIAENDLAALGNTSAFFDLIDDSLLSLDRLYGGKDEDDGAEWVDNHFRESLALIQEIEEQERTKDIAIIQARVKAIRRMTRDNAVSQAFASSGIPLRAALYLEENVDVVRRLAAECLTATNRTDGVLHFFYQMDRLIDSIPSERLIKKDLDFLDHIREAWLMGQDISQKEAGNVEQYYGYTVTWLLNALASWFKQMEEEEYQQFFEEMSLLSQYGMMSVWAIRIYLCGISSRKVATEIASKLEEPEDTSRLSSVAKYLVGKSEEIVADDRYSELAKGWILVLNRRPIVEKTAVPSVKTFRFSSSVAERASGYDILLCKKYGGKTFLCSPDYEYRVNVKDSDDQPFSRMADIPGVFFKRDGEVWKMENHNPYVEIEY